MIVANMNFSFLIGQLDSDLKRKRGRGERQMLLNRWSVVALFPQFPQFSHWVFNTSRNKASLRLASHRIASGHAMSAMIRASFFTYVIIAFNCTGQEPDKQTENKKENRQTDGQTSRQTDRRTSRHAVLCWPDR